MLGRGDFFVEDGNPDSLNVRPALMKLGNIEEGFHILAVPPIDLSAWEFSRDLKPIRCGQSTSKVDVSD